MFGVIDGQSIQSSTFIRCAKAESEKAVCGEICSPVRTFAFRVRDSIEALQGLMMLPLVCQCYGEIVQEQEIVLVPIEPMACDALCLNIVRGSSERDP